MICDLDLDSNAQANVTWRLYCNGL